MIFCTSNDYQITHPALLERSEQAHESASWFRHRLCWEKQCFVIKRSSGPRASLHPKVGDGSQPRLSHVHSEPQVWGSVAGEKPAVAIHISNLFWTLIWKHHVLPENSHWESTYSPITFLEEPLCPTQSFPKAPTLKWPCDRTPSVQGVTSRYMALSFGVNQSKLRPRSKLSWTALNFSWQ